MVCWAADLYQILKMTLGELLSPPLATMGPAGSKRHDNAMPKSGQVRFGFICGCLLALDGGRDRLPSNAATAIRRLLRGARRASPAWSTTGLRASKNRRARIRSRLFLRRAGRPLLEDDVRRRHLRAETTTLTDAARREAGGIAGRAGAYRAGGVGYWSGPGGLGQSPVPYLCPLIPPPDTLARSQEFKRGADNTVFHRGYPTSYRQQGGTPSIQISIAPDGRRADMSGLPLLEFSGGLFNGHLTDANSDVRAGNNRPA